MSATHFQKRLGRPDSKIMAHPDSTMVRLYRSATPSCSGVYLTVSWRPMPPPERYCSKSLPTYAPPLSLPSWAIFKRVWVVTRASNSLNLAKTSKLPPVDLFCIAPQTSLCMGSNCLVVWLWSVCREPGPWLELLDVVNIYSWGCWALLSTDAQHLQQTYRLHHYVTTSWIHNYINI